MTNLNWNNLGFSYRKTNTILCSWFKDGQWSPVESRKDDNLTINAFAGSLHYSVECFEGLKAFRGKDGKIRLFRPEENALRIQRSADFLGIPAPDTELFISMCKQIVRENEDFLPPYGSHASMYLRPTLIGFNPQLGVKSSTECLFMMLCSPVGAYTGGALEPCNAVIARDYDRAAPFGSGSYKVGANYAVSLYSYNKAHALGYQAVLYLDPLTHTKIDEFGSSNFFGIKNNTYITPLSSSILPSITNRSLMQLAEDMGLKVERRPVPEEELATFEEAGACGTAAVISPIQRIDDLENNKSYVISKDGKPGPISTRLYNKLRAIQYGDEPDVHGWVTVID